MFSDAAAIQTPAPIADFLALAVPVKKAVPVMGTTKVYKVLLCVSFVVLCDTAKQKAIEKQNNRL